MISSSNRMQHRTRCRRPTRLVAMAVALATTMLYARPASADRINVNPNQDASVSSNAPNTNFGGTGTLLAGVSADGLDTERSFINFRVDFPFKAIVTTAKLQLNCTFSSGSTQQVNRIIGAWAEQNPNGVTWNNQPPIDPNVSVAVGVNAAGIDSFDVTTMVQQLNCSYGGNIGFRIAEQNEVNRSTMVKYDSREAVHGTAPLLVVTYRRANLVVNLGQQNPIIVAQPTSGPSSFEVRFQVLVPAAECTKHISPFCAISDPSSPIRFDCPPGDLELQPGQTATLVIPGQALPGATQGQTNSIVLRTVDEDGYEVDSAPAIVEVNGAVALQHFSWSRVKNAFR